MAKRSVSAGAHKALGCGGAVGGEAFDLRDGDNRFRHRVAGTVVVDALVGQRAQEFRATESPPVYRAACAVEHVVGSLVTPLSEYATVAREPRKIEP